MFLMKIQSHRYRQSWHQSCSVGRQDAAIAGCDVTRCNGRQINRLGQSGRGSGDGVAVPYPANTHSGRPGGNTSGRPGKAGGHGGFSQPAGRDRPMGRMARRLGTTGDGEHPETRSKFNTGENLVASAPQGGDQGPRQKMTAMVKNTNPNQEFRRGERNI
jgi:hypothetical protein